MKPPRDYTPTVRKWFFVLGVLHLMGCNLGGLLYVWFGTRLLQYRRGFWWASVVLLAVQLVSLIAILVVLQLQGADHMAMRIGPARFDSAPIWVTLVLVPLGCAVLGVPLLMLIARGTRLAFHRMNEPNPDMICVGCGYNLFGVESRRCPECGLTNTRKALKS